MTYKQHQELRTAPISIYVVRADRKSKNETSKHGGCLIAVSNNFSFTEVDIRHLSEAIQESNSRNRSRIFKYLKSFQKEKFPPKIVNLDWNSVAKNSKEKAELLNTNL